MTDYLRVTIRYLPVLTLVVLVAAVILLELRRAKWAGSREDGSADHSAPIRSCQANAYSYHINTSASVLIRPGWFGSYRIYPVKGAPPAQLQLLSDRYGSYFSLCAGSADAAERELDRLYAGGGRL